MIRLAAVATLLAGSPAAALDLTLPTTARQTVERNTAPDIFRAPIGVFENGVVPTVRVEGKVDRSAWRIDASGLTPFQVMRPLRAQLMEAGFEIALDCAAVSCGGFDFRFAIETLPGPNMYVNIRAFHVVTALKGAQDAPKEVITVLASSSAASAYVQVIHAGEAAGSGTISSQPPASRPIDTVVANDGTLVGQLEAFGHAVLPDLDIATGSTELGTGPFGSLDVLAGYLDANPGMRVALVGHTATVGDLQANIAISRARARSVRERLVRAYSISPARLAAEGMGYLSPVATNLTGVGRDQNRRVEVVLLGPTEN